METTVGAGCVVKKFRPDYGINWVGNENPVHPVIRSKKADELQLNDLIQGVVAEEKK